MSVTFRHTQLARGDYQDMGRVGRTADEAGSGRPRAGLPGRRFGAVEVKGG